MDTGWVERDPSCASGHSFRTLHFPSHSNLPGGTTVITRYATWEMEGPPATIYHGKDCDEMLALAWSLIETDADYGEVCDEDEGEEVTEDTNTVTSGGKALAKKWKAAMRKRR